MTQNTIIQNKKRLTQSQLFQIEAVDLQFSNGEKRTYERIRSTHELSTGAVLIVPMLDDETFLLIREYYVGTERYELAFPKGKVEENEEILFAANREIMEEVGYQANNLQILKKITLAPGYMSFATHIVLARDLHPQRVKGDEPEELEVIPWKLQNIDQLIQRDDFSEARSLFALYLARDYLQKNKE